jgi:hypothetical protein
METKVEQKVVETEFVNENENTNDNIKVTVKEDGKAKKFWKKNKKWIIGAGAGLLAATLVVLKCAFGKDDEDDTPLLEAPEDDEESEDEEE